jgi:hypothetical protein
MQDSSRRWQPQGRRQRTGLLFQNLYGAAASIAVDQQMIAEHAIADHPIGDYPMLMME